MRPPFPPSITRLGVRPDEAETFAGPRPRGSRRPHADSKVAAVRRLVEQSTLTYAEIAARTGVACASICRWTRDGGWRRPPFAPRATDTVPSARASAKLKARTLAARLSALAESYVRELEETPGVDLDKLSAALELLKMAKLAAMGRRRRRRWDVVGEPRTGAAWMTRAQATRAALKEMYRGGVNVDRAPQEALDLLVDARLPTDDHPALQPRRGHRSKRNRDHVRMLEPYR
jgi:hypothetical protein